LKSILPSYKFGQRPAHSLYRKQAIARFAVQAYFHDREIMVTLPPGVQGIFMHMKEAI
jgi:hypothetical protein